jgi:hypothetical protein
LSYAAAVPCADPADHSHGSRLHVWSGAKSRDAGRQDQPFRLSRNKELPVFDNPALSAYLGTGRIPSADVAHALRRE